MVRLILIQALILGFLGSLMGIAIQKARGFDVYYTQKIKYFDTDEANVCGGELTEVIDNLHISVKEAAKLVGKPGVTFIDAREKDRYDEAHIKGAISLTHSKVYQNMEAIMSSIPRKNMIITYCDESECKLSNLLAAFLKKHGCKNVRVLSGGWSDWLQGDHPIQW